MILGENTIAEFCNGVFIMQFFIGVRIMAIKIYGIYNAENGERVATVQVKRKDMAEKCIAEYVSIGRLPVGEIMWNL